jgi:hypothetical protein
MAGSKAPASAPAAKRYVRLERSNEMKKALLAALMISLISMTVKASEDTQQQHQSSLPPGMKASMVTVEGIVERVFATDHNGARFRAYQVRWNDNDVIISDPLGTTDYQEGNQITFMANITEMKERKIKVLSFMVFDFHAYKK